MDLQHHLFLRTTATPKGIVHSHELPGGITASLRSITTSACGDGLSTPLYLSNPRWSASIRSAGFGPDAAPCADEEVYSLDFLALSQKHRPTQQTMRVPVPTGASWRARLSTASICRRFDEFGTSPTSAPFAAKLKADILRGAARRVLRNSTA